MDVTENGTEDLNTLGIKPKCGRCCISNDAMFSISTKWLHNICLSLTLRNCQVEHNMDVITR
jgi:hypothetical protein